MSESPAGLAWSPPAARVCRRPFCFSAEILTSINSWVTLHSSTAILVKVRYKTIWCDYRQGSEWCTAVGVVFDVMTNYQSIHDLKEKKKKSSNRHSLSKRLAGKIKYYNGSIRSDFSLHSQAYGWSVHWWFPLMVYSHTTNHSDPTRRAAAQSKCFSHVHNAKK